MAASAQTHADTNNCCGDKTTPSPYVHRKSARSLHPDHSPQLARLNRVIGQIEGIKRMIETRRYCPDILIQTRAAVSALEAVETRILEKHVRHCIGQAIASRKPREIDRKIDELITVIDRF